MEYINLCTDNIIPTKTIRCFPNNKAWIESTSVEQLKEGVEWAEEDDNKDWGWMGVKRGQMS